MYFRAIHTILFIILSISAIAQSNTISGKIISKDGIALGYTSISLKNERLGIIHNTVADSIGKFSIKLDSGQYTLSISQLNRQNKSLTITVNSNKDLGDIILESQFTIDEVLVEGRKKAFERKPDRLVFNVENVPGVDGMDLLEVLANTPMLRADDGGVSIAGKSSVSVMVNERIINLSGIDLIQYLKTLKVGDISKIEVITTPPAKYDAQGNSGLINISLKKKNDRGFNGSINSTYIQRKYGGISNTGSLNFQSDKTLISLGLSQYDIAYRATENSKSIGDNIHTEQLDVRKDFNDGVGLNFSIDHKVSKNSNLGAVYSGTFGHSNMDINSNVDFYDSNSLDSTLTTESRHRKTLKYQSASLYYDLNLDTTGRKIGFIGNFLSNTFESPVFFETGNHQNSNLSKVKNQADNNYRIYSIQTDLSLPYKFIQMEIGGKFSRMTNNSDIEYFDDIEDKLILDESRSNSFGYNENIASLYVSAFKQINKRISIKAGLRYEYTIGEGISKSTEDKNKREYGNLFPTGYISYNVNEKNTFSFSYSKRINRPSMGMLNPFRWYSNPYFYSSGNPDLAPSFNNNFELGYVYNGNLSFTLYYQIKDDGISQILEIMPPAQVYIWKNHLKEQSTGLNINYFLSKLNWAQTSLYGNINYTNVKSSLEEVLPQNGFNALIQVNNTIFLTKDKNFMFLLNYWQNMPGRSNNYHSRTTANFKAGVSLNVLNKKLSLSIMADDIFRQQLSRGTAYYSNYLRTNNNYYNAQKLNFSATYRFGKNNVKTKNKDTKFSEQGRAN